MKRSLLSIGAFATCAMGLLAADDQPYLAENLTVWLRADKGLTTNDVGGVTAWANQGTKGAAVDVAPHADNSAGHVAYEAAGIGGKPSLAFDGEVYLKTAAAADLGVTAAGGGAWFVVFKTPCTRAERTNMGIMGCVPGQRFGAFFLNDGTEKYRSFFYADIGDVAVSSNTTQIASAMCWKEGNTAREYPMNLWTLGSVVSVNPAPGSAVFMVGNMIPSWMQTFKGEIAEIRIYNRALTGRERTRIQLELSARYGVQWQGHGNIGNSALQFYANAVLLDGLSDDGVPEEVISSAEAGGLSISLDTPSAMNAANAYFTHNNDEGLARSWYLSAWTRTRTGSGLTMAFDIPASFARMGLKLLYRQEGVLSWSTINVTGSYEDGRLVFRLPPEAWVNGWYRLGFPTLSAWYRADSGAVTNAAGKIERWKNIGVASTFMTIDLVPTNETSHVAIAPDAANGRPAAQFDGEGFLRATAEAVFHKTALKPNPANENDKYTVGTAWFVVFKPCVDVMSRRNMAPFMLPSANAGNRCGLFFYYGGNGRQLQAYVYDNSPTTINAFDGWQIVSFARWARTSDLASMGQAFVNGAASDVRGPIWVGAWNAKIHMGHMGLDWGVPFEGDIAELRIYNAPLTATERALEEISLATHYGISVTTAGINGVPPADYQEDACVFNGKFSESPDVAPTNAVSGELTLTCIEETEQTPDLVTFVGHNESAWFAPARAKGRAPRSWFVSSGASNNAHRFEFVGVNAVEGDRLKLSYRPNLESAWQTIATTTGQATFDVPSLQRGFYTMEVSPGGLSIIIR